MAVQDSCKKDTIRKICNIVAEVIDRDEDTVKPEDYLSDLYMDSLDIVDAVIHIEKEFGIKMFDDEIYRCKTVQDLINLAMVRICENYDR